MECHREREKEREERERVREKDEVDSLFGWRYSKLFDYDQMNSMKFMLLINEFQIPFVNNWDRMFEKAISTNNI